MTSKVQSAADYWTIDVKMTSKVQPAADYWIIDVKDYWTIDRENLGTRLCHSTKREMAARSLQVWAKIIFWMNNKAIIEFGFRRIWRILQISEGVIHLGLRPRWITLSSTCRILLLLHTLLTFLTVSCLLSFRLICNLTQCSITQARCEIFAWLQPSFILFNSPWIKIVAKNTCLKTKSY